MIVESMLLNLPNHSVSELVLLELLPKKDFITANIIVPITNVPAANANPIQYGITLLNAVPTELPLVSGSLFNCLYIAAVLRAANIKATIAIMPTTMFT